MTPDLHWQAWCGWPGGCPPAAPPGSRGRCQGPPPGRRRPGRSDAAPSWRSPPGPWSLLALQHPLSGNPFYLMPLRLNTLCMNSCHPISPLALHHWRLVSPVPPPLADWTPEGGYHPGWLWWPGSSGTTEHHSWQLPRPGHHTPPRDNIYTVNILTIYSYLIRIIKTVPYFTWEWM